MDEKPIVVKPNQGTIDTATAALRLVIIIMSTAPAAALFVRKHDLIGLYNFFQSNQGVMLLSAVSGLAAMIFGLYKSFKRGSQVAAVAASPAVPPDVATTK